jgi:hypothetical protein
MDIGDPEEQASFRILFYRKIAGYFINDRGGRQLPEGLFVVEYIPEVPDPAVDAIHRGAFQLLTFLY